MDPALVLEQTVSAFPLDHRDHRLIAALAGFGGLHDLDLQLVPFREFHIHPKQISREQGGFVSARPGPDFQEEILLVAGVLRRQMFQDLRFEFSALGLQLRAFLRRQCTKLRSGSGIREHMGRLVKLLKDFLIAVKQLRHRFDFRPLLRQLDQQRGLADHRRIRELGGQLIISAGERLPLFQ